MNLRSTSQNVVASVLVEHVVSRSCVHPKWNESSVSPLHNIFSSASLLLSPKMLTQNDCCSSNVFASIEVKNAFDFDVKWKCDWWACACTEIVSRKRSNGRRIVVTAVDVEWIHHMHTPTAAVDKNTRSLVSGRKKYTIIWRRCAADREKHKIN